jgi:hypothetical protein
VVSFVTSRVGSTYILFDSTRGSGIYTMSANFDTIYSSPVDITSTTNRWPAVATDTQAIDAHWGAEKVYDYWLAEHGRLSWDGLDGMLLSTVHYNNPATGGPYNNAFWDGNQMVYGDGTGLASGGLLPLVSLDVAAHEIGHGVCQATANLVYEYESGAMNEGFSDCWAATIEHYANPGETDRVAKQPFKIGEEIRPGAPLRSMDNPLLQGDPATYGGTNWFDVASCTTPDNTNDNCGVHTNSGVMNHWYYFVVSGGSGTNDLGTAYSVNAIGWTDAAAILYETELNLAPTDDYAACRVASINAARTLFGSCSLQEQSVTNAWHAVGVGPAFVPCTPQIGFNLLSMAVTEGTSSTSCPASRTVNIALRAVGSPITGGSPTITIVPAGGTAVSGADYALGTSSVTFAPGDTTTRYATIVIYDNGTIRDNKTLMLAFTLSAAGSTATISNTNDTLLINISNNDSIPNLGGREYHTLNTGTLVTSNNTSAFPGAYIRSHHQYLLDASEMTAAGVRPNVPITQLAFNVTTKNSTRPFVNYTVSMGNTSAGNLASAYASAPTTVYSANHTTNVGWDSLVFTTPFVWDGTSNVVVDICYGANTGAASANDQMQGIDNNPYIVTNLSRSTSGSTSGCALSFSRSGSNTARPVMRFLQIVRPTAIETTAASNRTWTVNTGNEVYFYTPTADTNLIVGIDNGTNNLGCVNATISAAGTGFTAASFGSGNRSRKEVTITPTINGSTTTYDVYFYMTNTELASVSPTSLYLLRTTSATDAGITTSNTVVNTPTISYGTNYVVFRSTFTGFGRFFLTDNVLCSAPPTTVTAGGATTFCTGSNVALTAPSGTGYTYQWQNGGANITGATTRTYTATTSGNYTVIVTQAGCSATSAATTVTVLSSYVAPITGATGVCTGGTAMVYDSTTGGTWSSSNASIASINSTGTVFGIAPGTVTITYSYSGACGATSRTASMTVSNPTTIAAITGTTSACPGAGTTLSTTTTGGTWTSSNVSVATVNSATGFVSALASGSAIISYSITNAFGCTSTATVAYSVLGIPTAVITPTGATTFCTGSSVTLLAPSGTGISYQWTVGGSAIVGATSSSYVASSTGSFGVTISSTSGCSASATPISVVVSSTISVMPRVSITASPGTLVCAGSGSVAYTATPVYGGSAPAFTWFVNGATTGTGSSYSYTPADGDIVTCLLRSNEACATPDTAITSVTMTVSSYVSPAVSINAIPSDTVCEGNTGAFAAVPVNGGTAPSYTWNKNGTDVYTGPVYYYVPLDGDILTVTMRSNFVCRSTDFASSAPLTVHVVPVVSNTVLVTASATSIAPGGSVTFTASAPNAGSSASYQWLINNVPVAGATNSTFTTTRLTAGQIVTCRVQASNRCATPTVNTSTGVTVLVTTGVATVAHQLDALTVQPNPNNGDFIVNGSVGLVSVGEASIKVTNMLGQVVYTGILHIANNTISQQVSLSHLMANGVYIANITINETGATKAFRVVVDR